MKIIADAFDDVFMKCKLLTKGERGGAECVLLLVVLVMFFQVACRTENRNTSAPTARVRVGSPSDPFPRRLSDATGREVIVNARPERIASQTVGTDEILLAICDTQRIARLSPLASDEAYSYVVEKARAANLRAAVNAEEILAANPELIFVASFSRAETVETLQTAGAKVFRLGAFDSIEDIKENIRIVGYLIGEDTRAAALVEEMDVELNAARARIPQGTPPRIISYGVSGDSAGANTLFDSIVRAAGAVNIVAEKDFDGFPKISAEQVAQWNPDYLVVGAAPREFDAVRARLMSNPAIAASEAGREGRIILIDDRALLSTSHHITKAVDALTRGLYEANADR